MTCIPTCTTTGEVSCATAQGIKVVRFALVEKAGGIEMLNALSKTLPNTNYILSSEIDLKKIHQYLDLPNVLAIESACSITEYMMYVGDYKSIQTHVRNEIVRMLDFSVGHVGINGKSDKGAQTIANRLSKMFAFEQHPSSVNIFLDEKFELLTKADKGTCGHLQILTSSVERAAAYLEKLDAKFEDNAKFLPVGVKSAVLEKTPVWELERSSIELEYSRFRPEKYVFLYYLIEEIGGFAFHLGRKFY
jgi:2-dehydro-3-deoxyphosphogluconate aldolase/(4S)-4-hydroxy-2-oxoglutarate aldolase